MPNASLTIDGTEVIKKENGVVSLKNTNADTSLSFPANHAGIKTALNASGNNPIYAIRAFGQFNGSEASATLDISKCVGVSNITRTGTGYYLITFSNPMPSLNYSLVANAGENAYRTIVVRDYSPGYVKTLNEIYISVLNQNTNGYENDNCIHFMVVG